jgi:FkbM family methyltransferase
MQNSSLNKIIRRYKFRFFLICAFIFIVIVSFNQGKRRATYALNDELTLEEYSETNGKRLNINLYALQQPNDFEFECIKTKKVTVQVTICLHELENDVLVSKALQKYGIWEESIITTFMRMLKASHDIGVLDIGAHLGQYCLFAAKFGRRCIAVEPFYDNYVRIHKSALIERTQSMITLVVNGISDKSGEVKKLSVVSTNIASQGIYGSLNLAGKVNETQIKNDKYLVETITLNDLIHVIPSALKKVLLKIEIKNYEIKAFKKSRDLFKRLDILAIFLEWDNDKKNPEIFPNLNEIEEFIEYLYSNNFKPRDAINYQNLNKKEWKIWPTNVIWVKDNFIF